MKIVSLLLLGLISLPGWTLQLEGPAQLLEKASKNRSELRQVVFDLQKNLKEFVDLEQMSSYAVLVDQLEPVAHRLLLDEIYPGALKDLGAGFFAEAMKWLDPRNVNTDRLLFYFRWAQFDQAFRYSEFLEFVVDLPMTEDQLFDVLNKIKEIQKLSLRTLPDSPSLQVQLTRIISERAARAWKSSESEGDSSRWIGLVETPSGFSIILSELQEDILTLDSDEKGFLNEWVDLTLALKLRMQNQGSPFPDYLWNTIHLILMDALLKSLELEQMIEEPVVVEILQSLSASELRGFAQSLTAREKIPSLEYYQTFLLIYDSTGTELGEARLFDTQKWLALQFQKLSAPVALLSQPGEGQYVLEEQTTKKKWTFTLIKGVDDRVYASLGSSSGQVFKSFYYIGYDPEVDQFTAVEREPDIDSRPNPSIRFFWNDLGELEVIDHFGAFGFLRLKGQKSEVFPVYRSSRTEAPQKPFSAQRWVGEIEWLNGGQRRSVALVINEVNQSLFGRMTIYTRKGQPQNFVEYQYGKRVSQDLVTITSGLLQSRSLNHLRGLIENGRFRGVMIVGGRGIVTKEFILTLDETKAERNQIRSVK